MGAWDHGPFGNDDAADRCGDLHDAHPSERAGIVRAVLTTAGGGSLWGKHGRRSAAALGSGAPSVEVRLYFSLCTTPRALRSSSPSAEPAPGPLGLPSQPAASICPTCRTETPLPIGASMTRTGPLG
ncbi:DUF4259 domain-containing protein [Micromonospora sp. GCM10011542]|uniref:DUF4259 domain-containing protein n=1 Tax=Micromonospora sp. GCM10011542 TaxID=3317337 RepID=UPI0036133231